MSVWYNGRPENLQLSTGAEGAVPYRGRAVQIDYPKTDYAFLRN